MQSAPLHPVYDHANPFQGPMDKITFSAGYVLRVPTAERDVFIKECDVAVRKVCEKWRIAGGRLEWDSVHSRWNVLYLPTSPPPSYVTHTFTHSHLPSSSLPPSLATPWTPTSAHTTLAPPQSYFRHRSIPSSSRLYAKKDLPIISLHVTTFSGEEEVVYLGFTFAHSVFDGTGAGVFMRYFSLEINGLSWDPPVVHSGNQLEVALSHLATDATQLAKVNLLPASDVVPMTTWSLLRALGSIVYELFWERGEKRTIYIGGKLVERLLRETKGEVKNATNGEEYVSEGDIMVGWLLKAAFAYSLTPTVSVSTCSVFTIRSSLTFPTTPVNLGQYLHNANHTFSLPPLSVSQIQSLPLAQIALYNRRALNVVRQPQYIAKSYLTAIARPQKTVPARGWNKSVWMITNQAVAQLGDIDFGKGRKVEQYWPGGGPFLLDHLFSFNKFGEGGGWAIHGIMRRKEWESVEEVLESLWRTVRD